MGSDGDIKLSTLWYNEVKTWCLFATYGIQGISRKKHDFSAIWMYILTLWQRRKFHQIMDLQFEGVWPDSDGNRQP